MARSKSAQPPAPQNLEDTHAALAADSAQHGELITRHEQHLAAVDARFGLDGPYDRATVIATARTSMLSAAEHMLVIGRACVLLKEHEPHGSFGTALDEIGIARRTAQLAMQAAIKFGSSDAKRLIAGRLTASKLLELVTADDVELDMLAEGGTIAGKTLDEIDAMSARELKETLRRERKAAEEELAARDEITAKKDDKIRKLELKARLLHKSPFRERLEAALRELSEGVVQAISAADNVRAAMQAIDDMHVEAGEQYTTDVLDMLDGHARAIGAVANDISELAKA